MHLVGHGGFPFNGIIELAGALNAALTLK
jgi:hypothetical protein